MAHLDLSHAEHRAPVDRHLQHSHTMLLAAGIASFAIVGVAALMMAVLV